MIALDPKGRRPLYEQLYRELEEEILAGQYQPGQTLPGRRTMAERLGVSVNTVDTAYQMLAAAGIVESAERRGFIVQDTGGMLHVYHPPATGMPAGTERRTGMTDLSTGSIDTGLFPVRQWGRIQRELLYHNQELWQRGDMQGDLNLREQIAAYLSASRGVECTPEQIVVGAGIEYLLGCLAHLFQGSVAAIENPGYSRTKAVLENCGIRTRLVNIDAGGLPADALRESGANICYITPSHHFPTGVTMPARRRAQLLTWAEVRDDRYILEDDYDSEFRFDIRPLPSLQGMAGKRGHVIYLTTFSKSLAPGIRIACMVLPENLLQRYRQDFALYANTVSRVEQQTLADFMAEGFFTRHIGRMRHAYKKRKTAFAAALRTELGGGLTIRSEHSGLHFLLTYPEAGSERDMIRSAEREGILIRGLSDYYMADAESCPPSTVVAGYAGLDPSLIEETAAALARAWRART